MINRRRRRMRVQHDAAQLPVAPTSRRMGYLIRSPTTWIPKTAPARLFEERFTPDVMARSYLRLYWLLCGAAASADVRHRFRQRLLTRDPADRSAALMSGPLTDPWHSARAVTTYKGTTVWRTEWHRE
jgi:hypothetical protein